MEEWARTFDLDPAGYAAGRPGYPPEVFDVLESRCGLGPGTAVVEIGPGTGQATKELLARGARVHGVEPGPRLAAYLRGVLDEESLSVSVSTFEDVVLAEESVDLVVGATSFHWLEADASIAKVVTGLRPRGWVALWWNVFYDPAGPDAFSLALEPLYTALGDREAPHGGQRALDEGYWLGLFSDAGLVAGECRRFTLELDHAAEDLVALYSTFSGTRARPADERARFLAGVRAVADDGFGGRVRRRYMTVLYTAQKPG